MCVGVAPTGVCVTVAIGVCVGVGVGSGVARLPLKVSVICTLLPEPNGFDTLSNLKSWSSFLFGGLQSESSSTLYELGLENTADPNCKLVNSDGFRHPSSWNHSLLL
ncbi:MAG: hypothetical protein F4X34_07790 [Chloroflexi bacterium]|nr:hypothetical protein [Chloroflexota bacterium]